MHRAKAAEAVATREPVQALHPSEPAVAPQQTAMVTPATAAVVTSGPDGITVVQRSSAPLLRGGFMRPDRD